MKNPLPSIAVLVLSFLAGPQTFGAVANQTDADVPTPDVCLFCGGNTGHDRTTQRGPSAPRSERHLKATKPKWRSRSRMSDELGKFARPLRTINSWNRVNPRNGNDTPVAMRCDLSPRPRTRRSLWRCRFLRCN
jgi:hypothetical protein